MSETPGDATKSVEDRARDVIESISLPPGPKRNQCTVPAGRWTSVPGDAVFDSSPMPNSIWPLTT